MYLLLIGKSFVPQEELASLPKIFSPPIRTEPQAQETEAKAPVTFNSVAKDTSDLLTVSILLRVSFNVIVNLRRVYFVYYIGEKCMYKSLIVSTVPYILCNPI